MNVVDFLNNEFKEVVKEFNSNHDICYCTPADLKGKSDILGYIKLYLEDLDEVFDLYHSDLYHRVLTLIRNIEVVLSL